MTLLRMWRGEFSDDRLKIRLVEIRPNVKKFNISSSYYSAMLAFSISELSYNPNNIKINIFYSTMFTFRVHLFYTSDDALEDLVIKSVLVSSSSIIHIIYKVKYFTVEK